MTDQYQRLWGKALDIAVPETYTNLSVEQVLKAKDVFAKIIVQECMVVCLSCHDTWRWDDEPDSSSGPRDCAKTIKQHFGAGV